MSFSKDKQGHWRGKCTVQSCDCGSFLVEDATKVRCDYCDHVPVKHVKVLRSCTSEQCGCQSYDEDDEEGTCSYCGDSIKDHPAIIGKSTHFKSLCTYEAYNGTVFFSIW